MKKINLAVLFLILFSIKSNSQTAESITVQKSMTIDSLQKKIEMLESKLLEKNYTRVPTGDLEEILDTKVSDSISGILTKWIPYILLVFGASGLTFYLRSKSDVKSSVKEVSMEVFAEQEKKLNELAKRITDMIDTQDKKNNELYELQEKRNLLLERTINNDMKSIKEVNVKQDEMIKGLEEKNKKDIEEKVSAIDKQVQNSLEILWNDVAASKSGLAEKVNFKGDNLIADISQFLENEKIVFSDSNKKALIDSLMRCYYHTLPADKRNKKMIELLNRYKGFELLPQTYAHAAIALENEYEYSGNQKEFDSCIKCCNTSIEISHDYGTAYAIKLEIYVIRYSKAFNEKEKQSAEDEILRTFKSIEINQSQYLCIEILQRLELDRGVPFLQKYIELLEKLFQVQVAKISERACSDIFVGGGYNKEKQYTELVNIILNNYLSREYSLEGAWKAVNIIESGIKSEASIEITFNGATYELRSSQAKNVGYVLFLPAIDKFKWINFYKMNTNGTFQVIPGIYEFKENRLILCTNYLSNTRPDDFSSTPENKFYLETYGKIA